MSKNINILSQEVFNQFQNKLNFELSYQDYKIIILLMNQKDLKNIKSYISDLINNNIYNDYELNNIYISYIKMILSYYSDIYCKTNIQTQEFCLKNIKKKGLVLKYIL